MLGRWLQDCYTVFGDFHRGIKGQIALVYLYAHDLGAQFTRLVQGIALGIHFYLKRIWLSLNTGAFQYGIYTAFAHASPSRPFSFAAIFRVSIIEAARRHGREFTGFIYRPMWWQWRGRQIVQIGFIAGDDALAGTKEAFEALFLIRI